MDKVELMKDDNNRGRMCVIIGGPRELTTEEKERQIIQSIMTISYFKSRDKFRMNDFKELMQELMGNKEANIHDILEYFDTLEISCKEDIVEKCTDELIKPTLANLSFETNKVDYIREIEPNGYYNWTDEKLRKAIKRSKNPMEKKNLQRELSNRNYMNGKHRKGGKR